MATESVLCIKRNRLPGRWTEKRSIIQMDLPTFTDVCTSAEYEFVDRKKAESDPSLKQIIPYVVFQTRDLEKTAVYNRQGSEKRLHDLWSIGIGGHINPKDTASSSHTFKEILINGMTREIHEELESLPKGDEPDFLGIISEEETEVGSVHLGAVFRVLTQNPDSYSPGHELFDFYWTKTENLNNLNLELWSTLAIELMAKNG